MTSISLHLRTNWINDWSLIVSLTSSFATACSINKNANTIQGNTWKQSDPKGLWKKLNCVFHCTPASVLPKDVSHSSFANRFSTFFIEKIRKIWSGFPSLLSPETSNRIVPLFSKFLGVSRDDICKIILGSSTKSWKLDPWATFLVKDHIDILIQPITSIVNLSLSAGVVIGKFKCAVVTPLIKKPSLDATNLLD